MPINNLQKVEHYKAKHHNMKIEKWLKFAFEFPARLLLKIVNVIMGESD